MKDRFDLEDAIGDMANTSSDIETVIYAIGDSPNALTEDQLLNMLIGMKQMHEIRYQKMWATFEELIKNKKLLNNEE